MAIVLGLATVLSCLWLFGRSRPVPWYDAGDIADDRWTLSDTMHCGQVDETTCRDG